MTYAANTTGIERADALMASAVSNLVVVGDASSLATAFALRFGEVVAERISALADEETALLAFGLPFVDTAGQDEIEKATEAEVQSQRDARRAHVANRLEGRVQQLEWSAEREREESLAASTYALLMAWAPPVPESPDREDAERVHREAISAANTARQDAFRAARATFESSADSANETYRQKRAATDPLRTTDYEAYRAAVLEAGDQLASEREAIRFQYTDTCNDADTIYETACAAADSALARSLAAGDGSEALAHGRRGSLVFGICGTRDLWKAEPERVALLFRVLADDGDDDEAA